MADPAVEVVVRVGAVVAGRAALELDKNFFTPDFTWEDLGALLFPAAGAVVQADAPTVPATDNLSVLDNSFTKWKSEMRTEVLNGVDTTVPPEQRNP